MTVLTLYESKVETDRTRIFSDWLPVWDREEKYITVFLAWRNYTVGGNLLCSISSISNRATVRPHWKYHKSNRLYSKSFDHVTATTLVRHRLSMKICWVGVCGGLCISGFCREVFNMLYPWQWNMGDVFALSVVRTTQAYIYLFQLSCTVFPKAKIRVVCHLTTRWQ